MNYFNELLESYDKLKKRKFKLIYLNEQGTIIPNASVEDAIKQASGLPNIDIKKGEKPQYTTTNPKPYSGDIGIYKSQRNVAGLARISKGPLDGINAYIPVHKIISPEIQQKILQLMQGGQDASGQGPASGEQSTSGEGSANTQPPIEVIKPLDALTQSTLQKLFNDVKKFCEESKYESSLCLLKGFTKTSTSTGGVFTSTEGAGIAGRFNSATYISYDEELDGYKKLELSPEMIDKAVDSFAAVVKAALNIENSCDTFKKSIGLIYGKDGSLKKVLYKIDPDQNDDGVIMPLGVMDEGFIRQAHENCKGSKRSQRTTIGYAYGGAKSNVKGSLAESMVDLTFIFRRFESKNLSKQEQERVSNFLGSYLQTKRDAIKSLAENLEGDSETATNLETGFINEVIKDEYLATSSVLETRQYLAKELSYQRQMINEFFPNAICSLNTASEGTAQTGERSDRKFIYTDRRLAIQDFLRKNENSSEEQVPLEELTIGQVKQLVEEKCRGKKICSYRDQLNLMLEAGGLKDKSDRTKLFLISVGIKRYGVLHDITLGTIDSTDRMHEIFNQTNPRDSRLAEGFVESVFTKLNLDEKSKQDMFEFEQKIQRGLDSIELMITSNYALTNGEKPDFSDPIQVCKRLNDILKTNSRKDDPKFKSIIESFEKAEKLKRDENGKLIDKTKVIPTLIAKIQKLLILKELQNSLNKNEPKVRNMLLAQLFLTGSTNDDDMFQSMTDDNGATKVIKHNEIFNVILEAEKTKNLNIELTDSGARFSVKNNPDIYLDLKIDTSKGYAVKIPKKSINNFNVATSSNLSESNNQIKSDLLEEVFMLQEKIINFINQGR
jgi:hypothetical protein